LESEGPELNMIKMNWDAADAAVNMNEQRIRLGIIARDLRGKFLATRSLTHEYITNPTTAEAMAALHAVLFSKEMSFVKQGNGL
jgi:hypothetical protein